MKKNNRILVVILTILDIRIWLIASILTIILNTLLLNNFNVEYIIYNTEVIEIRLYGLISIIMLSISSLITFILGYIKYKKTNQKPNKKH